MGRGAGGGRPRLDEYRAQGRALREYRQHAGLSQPDLAQLIGCTKQHVFSVERGERPASAVHLLTLIGLAVVTEAHRLGLVTS